MSERQTAESHTDGGFSEAAKLRHILEDSEEYKQRFEERPKLTVISGDDTLNVVTLLRSQDSGFRDQLGISPEQAEALAERQLTGKVAELAGLLSQEATGDAGIRAHAHTLKLLKGLPGYTERYGEIPDDAAEALGKIQDAELAERFLAAHFVESQREARERQVFASVVKQEFAEAVAGGIGEGGPIPEKYRALIMDRIGRTQIEFFDVYQIMKHSSTGTRNLAFFDAEHQVAIVDPNLSDGLLQHTLTHELFHAISGKTLQQEGSDGPIRVQRLGLEITGREDGPERFTWINEALTEKLTMMILGKKESLSYPHERAGLDELDVPLELLLAAYFEDFQDSEGEKVPGWKQLNDYIDKHHGPGFLTKLDHEIEAKNKSCIQPTIRRAAAAK